MDDIKAIDGSKNEMKIKNDEWKDGTIQEFFGLTAFDMWKIDMTILYRRLKNKLISFLRFIRK